MAAFSTATVTQTTATQTHQHEKARALATGWWLLPSVLGGGAIWWQVVMALLG